MQKVIIEITEDDNNAFYVEARKYPNRRPIGNHEDEYSQVVYHPLQVARAIRWVSEDVVRNNPNALIVKVKNLTNTPL